MNPQNDSKAGDVRALKSLLGSADATPPPAKPRKVYPALVALLLIFAGMSLVIGVGWGKFQRGRACLDSALTRMRVLQDAVPGTSADSASLGVEGVGVELHGLKADLVCLRAEAGEFLPLAPLLGWLPKVGADIASLPVLLDMAQSLMDGGVLVLDGISPLLEQLPAGVSPADANEGPHPEMAQVVKLLEAAEPSLMEAEQRLQRAAELRDMLDAESLSPRLGRLLALTDRYLPLLRTGVTAAQTVPELMGAGGPRRYLILAQNDDERRPTGGWISGVGLVAIDQGQITELTFLDSWAVDNLQVPHETPPDAMLRVLWAGIWLLRDANWSPDFPTSAQVAEDILLRDRGVAVDGVIAVDQAALQLLVTALEPLTLESEQGPVTGANVLSTIRESWAQPEEGLTAESSWQEWEAHRKDFMSDLVSAMLDKVENQTGDVDLAKLANAVLQGLRQRHILIYLHEEQAAQMLAAQRWDGALLETDGDYYQLVDANVGFNKVDPNVQRSITYLVDLTDPKRPLSRAVVRYRNNSQPEVDVCLQGAEWEPSYVQRMHGCFWDYVRFYVPEGAQLLETTREPLPAGSLLSRYRYAPLGDAGPEEGMAEKDKRAFGLFFVLPPGEEREVEMAWELPADIIREELGIWRYKLLVQKQSSAPPIPLEVAVLLPPGSNVLATSPESVTIHSSGVTFVSSLSTDQYFEVLFEGGN